MHDTALFLGSKILSRYARSGDVIVDFGSYDFNGSLRNFSPTDAFYFGVDVEHGPSVDFVVKPGEPLPLKSEFADIVISTSQMEHDPFFWDTFLELVRITKAGGKIYINTPSNGPFHRYPKDYWRFYPDSGLALQDWALRKGNSVKLVESFTAKRRDDIWNDFVALFEKTPSETDHYEFLSTEIDCSNVYRIGEPELSKVEPVPQDMQIIQMLKDEIGDLTSLVEVLRREKSELTAVVDEVRLTTPQIVSDDEGNY